ncbi:MAG: hypothetical protein Q9183_000411 [Haloplaca sp. 2 TL-2023]
MSLRAVTLPRFTPITLTALGLGTSLQFLHSRRQPLLCEPSSPLDTVTQKYLHSDSSGSIRTQRPATNDGTARIIRQLSLGSVLGVMAGVAVSAFSKVLAGFLGLAIVIVQYAASKGYNIIPVRRIQSIVKGMNVRSAIEENPAFKLSFGTTFALASLVKF